jgi:hypothetical protein
MLISKRDHGVVVDHPLTVAGDVVVFSNSVKNPGLYIDIRRVVSRTFSTVALSISEIYFSWSENLLGSIVDYTDVVYSPSLTGGWSLGGSHV